MIRLEVATIVDDARAHVRLKKLGFLPFAQKISDIFLLDVYTIDKKFSKEDVKKIGSALSNPLTQIFSSGTSQVKPFSYAIEIGFLPGVTDNVSHTVKETIEDLLKVKFENGESVYTSQVTFVVGSISKKDAQEIANLFHNPLIQRSHVVSHGEFVKDGMGMLVPKVRLQGKDTVQKVRLDVADGELLRIGKEGIKNNDGTRRGPLALDLVSMKAIQEYFSRHRRNPTDIEIESLAQTWSEHCKHTIFADPIDDIKDGLFATYIKKATEEIRKTKEKSTSGDFCISVFTDNSGGIIFDATYAITHKVETHNTPSALDPFGGAITGIVGVNRDTLGYGLGAKPVANFYGFCFADPRHDVPLYQESSQTQKMLSSRRIMDGVIDGVNAGGNQSGIPTPQGFVYFDERYRAKPLVFVGTVGLIPRKIKGKLSHIKKAMPGDYIVMAGGRVGKDGIHGATFSSQALTSGSPATAVQIGDPITQKKLSDVLIKEARDMLLYHSITDNGAGGLSCSVAEMAKESGGCIVQLEKVPLKYKGLAPWEVWISESQERMTLAIPKKMWKKFHDLLQRRGVESTVIGQFTNSGKCIVTNKRKVILDIELEFLHNGLPKRQRSTTYVQKVHEEPKIIEKENYTQDCLALLQRLNITSYSFISQQYDSVVQAGSVLPPLQGRGRVNADTSVFRPVLSSKKGVVLSQGLYPSYGDIDTYHMAAASLDTALRNAVAAGANPDSIAILDNFCWTDSTNPERLGELKRALQAAYTYAVLYQTPFISGKDSMFNDFHGYDREGKPIQLSIPKTLLISSIGVIDDITKVVSLDTKIPRDLVYVLGDTYDEMGASEYFAYLSDTIGNQVPHVDAQKNKKLYKALYVAIQKGIIASSQSVYRGGLAIALIKKAIGGMLGLTITLKNLPGSFSTDIAALFSESQGRIVVSISPANKDQFEKILQGNSYGYIGTVTQNPIITISNKKGKKIVSLDIQKAFDAYTKTFSGY